MNPLLLIVLSLVACTSVISALSQHGQGDPVLDTSNVASNGAFNVRNLKQDVTSDPSAVLEDRTITTSLRYRLERLFHYLRLRFGRTTPEAEFNSLVLLTEEEELFGSPRFAEWARLVRRKYPTSANEKIIEPLVGKYTHSGLATLLLKALEIPGQKKMARRTYRDLVDYWVKKKTTDQVYNLLKPEEMNDLTFYRSDLMLVWVDYVKQAGKDQWKDIIAAKIADFPTVKSLVESHGGVSVSTLATAKYEEYKNSLYRKVRQK